MDINQYLHYMFIFWSHFGNQLEHFSLSIWLTCPLTFDLGNDSDSDIAFPGAQVCSQSLMPLKTWCVIGP
jgi:hypothetical protein